MGNAYRERLRSENAGRPRNVDMLGDFLLQSYSCCTTQPLHWIPQGYINRFLLISVISIPEIPIYVTSET